MGTGCYYTNKETGTRAFWMDINPYYQDEDGNEVYDDYLFDDLLDNLKYELKDMGFDHIDNQTYQNTLYTLHLEGGHGHELIFRLEPRYIDAYHKDDIRLYNLALGSHERNYNALAKKLIKLGYELSIATSGYTSAIYTI